jgi:hypothetical protein
LISRISQDEPEVVVSDLGGYPLPSSQDDMQQPTLDFEAAAQYVASFFLCGYFVTTDLQGSVWNKGDFFGDLYATR